MMHCNLSLQMSRSSFQRCYSRTYVDEPAHLRNWLERWPCQLWRYSYDWSRRSNRSLSRLELVTIILNSKDSRIHTSQISILEYLIDCVPTHAYRRGKIVFLYPEIRKERTWRNIIGVVLCVVELLIKNYLYILFYASYWNIVRTP